jgi:hypothetical protein
MRTWLRAVLVIVATVVVAMGMVVPSSGAAGSRAASPYCGLVWGSLPERGMAMTTAPIVDVRAGRHRCFDRLVVDLGAGPVPRDAYDVRYVPVVRADGSGHALPVRGAADLQVVVRAAAYDRDTGAATYSFGNGRELVPVGGFRTLRQVATAGSFEGQTTFAVGVRARLPFRVFALSGPGSGSRLVVDVAHRW